MSPSFDDAARVLELHMRDGWVDTDVHWDGSPPQDAPQDRPYLDFSVHIANAQQVAMPFLARCDGMVLALIKTPAGLGTRTGFALADKAVSLFAGQKIDFVTCRMGSVRHVPQTEAATDERFAVTIPFFYHAQK